MDTIKKAGILVGAVAGGLLGGTISLVGKVSKLKVVDDIGGSITNSLIFTGALVGEAASGAADMASGKITKDDQKAAEGWEDVKGVGEQVVGNFVNNARLVINNSGEIAYGVKELDGRKIASGAKKLAKIAAVGALTVGAIKLKETPPGQSAAPAGHPQNRLFD